MEESYPKQECLCMCLILMRPVYNQQGYYSPAFYDHINDIRKTMIFLQSYLQTRHNILQSQLAHTSQIMNTQSPQFQLQRQQSISKRKVDFKKYTDLKRNLQKNDSQNQSQSSDDRATPTIVQLLPVYYQYRKHLNAIFKQYSYLINKNDKSIQVPNIPIEVIQEKLRKIELEKTELQSRSLQGRCSAKQNRVMITNAIIEKRRKKVEQQKILMKKYQNQEIQGILNLQNNTTNSDTYKSHKKKNSNFSIKFQNPSFQNRLIRGTTIQTYVDNIDLGPEDQNLRGSSMNMNNPLMRRSSLKQSNNNFNSIKKSFNHQNSLVQPILMGSIKQSNIRKSNIRQSNINYIEQDEQQLPHELTMNKKVSTKSNKKSYMPPLDSMVRVQIEQDSMEDLNNTHRSHNRHRSNNSNNNYNNYNNNNYDNINYGNNNDNIMQVAALNNLQNLNNNSNKYRQSLFAPGRSNILQSHIITQRNASTSNNNTSSNNNNNGKQALYRSRTPNQYEYQNEYQNQHSKSPQAKNSLFANMQKSTQRSMEIPIPRVLAPNQPTHNYMRQQSEQELDEFGRLGSRNNQAYNKLNANLVEVEHDDTYSEHNKGKVLNRQNTPDFDTFSQKIKSTNLYFYEQQQQKLRQQKKHAQKLHQQISIVIGEQGSLNNETSRSKLKKSNNNMLSGIYNQQNNILQQNSTSKFSIKSGVNNFIYTFRYVLSQLCELNARNQCYKLLLRNRQYQVLTFFYSHTDHNDSQQIGKGPIFAKIVTKRVQQLLKNQQKQQVNVIIAKIFNHQNFINFEDFGAVFHASISQSQYNILIQHVSKMSKVKLVQIKQILPKLFSIWLQINYFQQKIKKLYHTNSFDAEEIQKKMTAQGNRYVLNFDQIQKFLYSTNHNKVNYMKINLFFNKYLNLSKFQDFSEWLVKKINR